MSTHIESKLEDISSVVLMPGDPKRCEYIARKFLANSKIAYKCLSWLCTPPSESNPISNSPSPFILK